MSYPYEIHLTVSGVDREQFEQACQAVRVKPVLLELQSRAHGILIDAMTSSRITGNFNDAIQEAFRISMKLRLLYNMPVVRYKIETVPWHPDADNPETRKPSQYMESHLQLHIQTEQLSEEFWAQLTALCAANDLHLSRNVFKRNVEEGTVIHMATLRDYKATYEDFSCRVQSVSAALKEQLNIVVGKTEIEFAVLDTNPTHDGKWMETKSSLSPLCPEIVIGDHT